MTTPIVGLNSFSTYPLSYVNTSSYPSIYSVPTISSITPSYLSNTYMAPVLKSVISYQDVNNDRNLKKQVTDYFFDKLLKNWLKYHYLELYQLVNINNGTASLIKNIKDAETNNKNDSTENGIKYTFLVDNYMTKNDIYKLLSQFRKINNINWWDMKHYKDKVRRFILHRVLKCIKRDILKGSK